MGTRGKTPTRRKPPGERRQITLWVAPSVIERLEAYCLRRATVPPFKDVKPSAVVRRAVLHYLEELEAEEALIPHRRARPPCVFAKGVGGLAWCPEHDARWEIGGEVPETCRGDE